MCAPYTLEFDMMYCVPTTFIILPMMMMMKLLSARTCQGKRKAIIKFHEEEV
jgi:hypothetical protein